MRPHFFHIKASFVLAGYLIWYFIQVFFIGLDRDYLGIAVYTVKVARLGEEFFIGAMLFMLFVKYKLWLRYKFIGIIILCALALALFIFSIIANQIGVGAAILFFDLYLSWPIVFLFTAVFYKYHRADFNRVFKTFVILMSIQFVMNAAWFLHINPIRNPMMEGDYAEFSVDWAAGTLMNPMHVAFLSCIVLSYCAYFYVFRISKQDRVIKTKTVVFLVSMSCLQLIWTDTKQVFLFFPLSFLLCYMALAKAQNLIKNASRFLGIFLIFGILLFAREQQYGKADIARTVEGVQKMVGTAFMWLSVNPKGKAYGDMITKIPHELLIPALGAGPGKLNSRIAVEGKTPLAKKYYIDPLEEWGMLTKFSLGTWDFPYTGFLTIIGELGILFAILYWGSYIAVFVHIIHNLRKNRYSKESAPIAFSLSCFILFWCFESLIIDHLTVGPMVSLIWMGAGMLYMPPSKCTASELHRGEPLFLQSTI